MQPRALAAFCLAALTTDPCAAQPGPWDVARQPALAREYELLVSVESFLLGHARAWDDMNVHKATIDYLRGEEYLEPRLELLLAELRFEATERVEQRVKQRLLALVPGRLNPSLVPRAYLALAELAATSGDLEQSSEYATRALEGLWETELRAFAYYTRAKSSLERLQPNQAVPDYQRAIALAHSPKVRALSHWGYAVALERSGNLNAALGEVSIATRIRVRSTAFIAQSVLDLPDVSFVPAFDRYYYKGLAALAAAENTDIAEQAAVDCQAAVSYFDRYLEPARVQRHPYLYNAERLKRRCEELIARVKLSEQDALETTLPESGL